MKKNILFTASAIIAGAAVAFGATALTFAQAPVNGNGGTPPPRSFMPMHGSFPGRGTGVSQEQKDEWAAQYEQMQAAMDAGDYDAWRALVPENSPLGDVITAENFDRFIEMHQLMNEAHDIAEELGLPGRQAMGPHMMGYGHHMMHDLDDDGDSDENENE